MHTTYTFFILFSTCAYWPAAYCSLFEDLADIVPSDPKVVTGGILTLECRLKPSLINDTADCLNFKLEHNDIPPFEIPSKFVNVTSRTTARLVYPVSLENVKKKKVHLCCYCGDKEASCAMLSIAVYPVAPTLSEKSCTNYNWEYLICSWKSLNLNNPGALKIHEQGYIHLRENHLDSFPKCINEETETEVHSCTLNFPDLPLTSISVSFHVISYHNLANATSDTVNWLLDHILKADVITSIETRNISIHSAVVQWKCPLKLQVHCRELQYEVSVQSEWNNSLLLTKSPETPTGLRISLKLDELLPYTRHQIYIRSKPLHNGYYSNQSVSSFKTAQDVPGALPSVNQGGFVTSPVNETHKRITLYWKNIPRMLENGVMLANYVTQTSTLGVTKHNVSPQNFKTDLILKSDIVYFLSVASKNEKGFNLKLQQDVVVVPLADRMLEKVKNLTVIGRRLSVAGAEKWMVRVGWNSYSAVSHILVTWCRASKSDYICQNEIEWRRVTSNNTYTDVDFDNGTVYPYYIFGVSAVNSTSPAEDLYSTSGIYWNDCNHAVHVSNAPTVDVAKQDGSKLILNLQRPSCKHSRGFVYAYYINYCRIQHKGSEDCLDPGSRVDVRTGLGSMTVAELPDLSPSQWYLIKVVSVTHAGPSHPPTVIEMKTEFYGVPGWVAVVILVVIVLALFLVRGLCVVARKCVRTRKQCAEGFQKKIELTSYENIPQLVSRQSNSYAQTHYEVVKFVDRLTEDMRPTPLGASASSDSQPCGLHQDQKDSLDKSLNVDQIKAAFQNMGNDTPSLQSEDSEITGSQSKGFAGMTSVSEVSKDDRPSQAGGDAQEDPYQDGSSGTSGTSHSCVHDHNTPGTVTEQDSDGPYQDGTVSGSSGEQDKDSSGDYQSAEKQSLLPQSTI